MYSTSYMLTRAKYTKYINLEKMYTSERRDYCGDFMSNFQARGLSQQQFPMFQ